MHILLTTDVIHAGGAETFVLRLAQALHCSGHKVLLYPLYKNRIDRCILKALAPDVSVLPGRLHAIRLLQVIDGALRRMRIDFSVVNFLLARHLAHIVKTQGIDVIHSHLFTADVIAVAAGTKTGVPVVTTIHGDYSAYDGMHQQNGIKHILRFRYKMQTTLSQMKAIVCICEEQLCFFREKRHLFINTLPLHKIYNGFDAPHTTVSRKAKRNELNIPEGAFVFCMVARGIPEKGWEATIQAFSMLSTPACYLLLIGHSEYVQSLKNQFASEKIIFLGMQQQPFLYLAVADAGIFCSHIKTEALPTVIIEYLAAGLPVISTSVGEADIMLATTAGKAGITVPLTDHNFVAQFSAAMQRMAAEPDLLHRAKALTREAKKKFDMQTCLCAYEKVYRDLMT